MEKIAIIGGGASGCFAGIQIAEFSKHKSDIFIFEKSKEPLAKVKISGGGRCNVTHHLFDPEILSQRYPRGEKELRWAFETFQPKDTIEWFRRHGVELKVEEDGRMFPVTNESSTIIDCFLGVLDQLKVKLKTDKTVSSVYYDATQSQGKFELRFADETSMRFDRLVIATGSNRKVWGWMEALGHKVISPVPSLFTLAITNSDITSLAGLSVPSAKIRILPKGKPQTGALLITHWGFSGPSALRLSAWEARSLFEVDYKTDIEINWLGDKSMEEIESLLYDIKNKFHATKILNQKLSEIPTRLWEWFLIHTKIPSDKKWVDISKNEIRKMAEILSKSKFQMVAKGIFKDEFVTAGGISRKEINFKTMQSKLISELYFVGEVIDIDGITGGFNFQNAWTTATIAAGHIAKGSI